MALDAGYLHLAGVQSVRDLDFQSVEFVVEPYRADGVFMASNTVGVGSFRVGLEIDGQDGARLGVAGGAVQGRVNPRCPPNFRVSLMGVAA
jgi:hypothetical protein